ncbi:MAG: replication-relaxation family protein [Pirellulaceae bacterium]
MPLSLHLQSRDVKGLQLLGELGLLDTDTLHARCFSGVTRRRCQQRLRLWNQQGLTRSVHLSVWFSGQSGGRVPSLHCLTERGAEAVHAACGQRPRYVPKLDISPETFYHRLAVVKARLAIDDCFQGAGLEAPQWIFEQDRRADAKPSDSPSQQRVLYHSLTAGGVKVICQPDAASWMKIPRSLVSLSEGSSDLLGYWEIDRSTESRSQIARKLPGYVALVDQRGYRRYWPQIQRPSIRVFWVCRSEQRIVSLRERLHAEPVSQIFRFTTAAELAGSSTLSAAIWQAIDGSRRSIVRSPP